ncbi:hypothetical protein CDD80_6082 [Ophiocordyceps camponoti-rufipedis]|uniref:Uncharacterized protein n=1 Tax=Ophiocordyceps camponoti-rufipedis TaxID=2004952 RepID=A0A2C5ZG71_9HYPO|nr:hypothetical protein CDD80_6082 [Ophiocordyceps camponoti-rufipedis]
MIDLQVPNVTLGELYRVRTVLCLCLTELAQLLAPVLDEGAALATGIALFHLGGKVLVARLRLVQVVVEFPAFLKPEIVDEAVLNVARGALVEDLVILEVRLPAAGRPCICNSLLIVSLARGKYSFVEVFASRVPPIEAGSEPLDISLLALLDQPELVLEEEQAEEEGPVDSARAGPSRARHKTR